jgi:DNA uptake protein ComE-like DNA-binding protein
MRHPHTGGAILALALISGAASDTHAQVGRNQGVLNPDLASEADLRALPGLDSALVPGSWRATDSPAWRRYALLSASLSRTSKALYPRLFLPINLNATSREEILLVPGVGARMAGEFEEYRPYQTLQQFRREIGKYVDSTEVARLEQFVFVPIDLNSASDEDIMSIPGMGRRMLLEFKEYRPYQSIEQFRREIGIHSAVVARLGWTVRGLKGGGSDRRTGTTGGYATQLAPGREFGRAAALRQSQSRRRRSSFPSPHPCLRCQSPIPPGYHS